MKLHIFATIHKVNTYSEKLFPPMTIHRFGVDPSEIMTSRETQELRDNSEISIHHATTKFSRKNINKIVFDG